MKIRKRYIVALIITLIISAFLSGILYRRSEIAFPNFLRSYSETRMLMSMQGFRVVEYEDDKAPWTMDARQADLYANKEARMRDIEVVFTGDSTRMVTLLGDEGILDTESGDAVLRKGAREVRVMTSDGYLLTTSSLSWNPLERTLRTSDPFKLLGTSTYLEGRGFSADTDLHMLTVNDRVKAVFHE